MSIEAMETIKDKNKLTGQKNQCPSCNEYFNSNFAFEKHRTGRFGVDRRCLTVKEMIEKKWIKKDSGFWTTGSNPVFAEKTEVGNEH